jgi:hypothetical protein
VTILFYLSDVPLGGETLFPRASQWWDDSTQSIVSGGTLRSILLIPLPPSLPPSHASNLQSDRHALDLSLQPDLATLTKTFSIRPKEAPRSVVLFADSHQRVGSLVSSCLLPCGPGEGASCSPVSPDPPPGHQMDRHSLDVEWTDVNALSSPKRISEDCSCSEVSRCGGYHRGDVLSLA